MKKSVKKILLEDMKKAAQFHLIHLKFILNGSKINSKKFKSWKEFMDECILDHNFFNIIYFIILNTHINFTYMYI